MIFILRRTKSFLRALLVLFFMGHETYGQDHYILNKGIPNNNVSNLLRRLKRSVLKHDPSLVIIMIGTNDMINPPKRLSYAAYRQKLDTLVKKIKNNGSDVLLLSLPPVDTEYLFTRHRRKKYSLPPNERIDSANNIIRKIATDQQCMFLDINGIFKSYHSPNRTASSLIRNEKNARAKDGVHPTPEGYKIIAERIAHFLKNRDKSYPKIICYGDSITFGAFVKGEGSTRKETYPAVLKRLLFPQ